jgi:UDP-2,3-diacylglucosamine pyrophosphatase LpxH
MDLVDPSFTRRVAEKMNAMSYRTIHRSLPSNPPPALRTFAHQKFLEGFDVVILGHSHVPEEVDEWVDGRRCLYFNVGDWRIHRSFLRYTPPEVFQLLRFEENG